MNRVALRITRGRMYKVLSDSVILHLDENIYRTVTSLINLDRNNIIDKTIMDFAY